MFQTRAILNPVLVGSTKVVVFRKSIYVLIFTGHFHSLVVAHFQTKTKIKLGTSRKKIKIVEACFPIDQTLQIQMPTRTEKVMSMSKAGLR